jgi:hypothetical protein
LIIDLGEHLHIDVVGREGVGVSAKPDRLDPSADGSGLARRISLANPGRNG